MATYRPMDRTTEELISASQDPGHGPGSDVFESDLLVLAQNTGHGLWPIFEEWHVSTRHLKFTLHL